MSKYLAKRGLLPRIDSIFCSEYLTVDCINLCDHQFCLGIDFYKTEIIIFSQSTLALLLIKGTQAPNYCQLF